MNAYHEAQAYATRHGLYVIVYEAGGGQREVAVCPPTLMADEVPDLVFAGIGNLGIDARLN